MFGEFYTSEVSASTQSVMLEVMHIMLLSCPLSGNSSFLDDCDETKRYDSSCIDGLVN